MMRDKKWNEGGGGGKKKKKKRGKRNPAGVLYLNPFFKSPFLVGWGGGG